MSDWKMKCPRCGAYMVDEYHSEARFEDRERLERDWCGCGYVGNWYTVHVVPRNTVAQWEWKKINQKRSNAASETPGTQ